MITRTAVDATTIRTWLTEAGTAVRAEREYLTQLDAAIGDGDHGTNMARGFDAVDQALAGADEELAPGAILVLAGRTLVSTVGGASGPLWGSALRRAGKALGDAAEVDVAALAAALDAGIAAIVELGAANVGDKTMVDALQPAATALARAAADGAELADAVDAAAVAAQEGAAATTPMQARKGRASYLGERSIGHPDPGATSAAILMRALHRAVVAAS